MTATPRVLLGFLGIAWIAACAGLIAMAWNRDRKLDIEFSGFDLEAFIVADNAERWIFTVLLVLVALLGVLAVVLAVRRGDRAPKGRLRLKQADGGTVEVTTDALESLVAAEMRELPDVHNASARVRLKRKHVVAELVLGIGGHVSIASITATAGTKLNEVFRDQVGVVDVRRPLVRIEYAEGPPPAGSRPPQPPEPAYEAEPDDATRYEDGPVDDVDPYDDAVYDDDLPQDEPGDGGYRRSSLPPPPEYPPRGRDDD